MRIGMIIITFFLSACSVGNRQSAQTQTYDFYKLYLISFSSLVVENRPQLLNQYVSADTLKRLNNIANIPEQEIVNSDYFTYTQDYDPAWIPALKVGKPQAMMGSEVVDVWLGVENHQSLHLQAWLREENGRWKIYRVRDITDNFEHRIFSYSK
ncbi:YbjP/YqhG family protein [Erwinia rhapontici]|uniref:YbjP/YqhG family protein n=1 Tax=Erwinia rhapontici TaxID=55212 RepID=UPI003BA2394E